MDYGEHSSDRYTKAIALLDKLLDRPGWERSRLLTASHKRLQKIRDGLQMTLEKMDQQPTEGIKTREDKTSFDEKPGMVRIYISLYQTDGARKRSWEQVLRSLSSCSIGRPMYFEEEHVRQFIQSRPRLEREGYVCVYVTEKDVLQGNIQPKDKNGYPLATLQPHALKQSKPIQFVHANSHRYKIIESKLVSI